MRAKFVVVCAALLCAMLGSTALAQGKPEGKLLSGEELKATFGIGGGALMDGKTAGGNPYTLVLLTTGKAYLLWLTPYARAGHDVGRWRIEGDALCFNWTDLGAGADRCRRHYKVGENTYQAWTLEGVLNSTYSLRR